MAGQSVLESVRAFAEASAVNCLLLLPSAVLAVFVILWVFSRVLLPFVRLLLDRTPSLDVQLDADDEGEKAVYEGSGDDVASHISCVDPATRRLLGHVPIYSDADVAESISRARDAQAIWKDSSLTARKLLLSVLNKYILEHAETICKVAARDSGKVMVDAAFGELMVTCEKMMWLVHEGGQYIAPEYRQPGRMMFYKSCRIEYVPVGVVGTIVPWNYPFHNVFNPVSAAVFAGCAIVVKVSEHASYSSKYYQRIIDAALLAAGAPLGLVQIITGEIATGRALVRGGCDKVIFIGSTAVGRCVMRDAADSLTPVTLELGGKDPFIVCDDADMRQATSTAMRAAFQSCGQNCVAAERFLVQAPVYEEFVTTCGALARAMRQGPPLGGDMVDCGALCLPGLADKVHALVEDARSKGARIVAGGVLPGNALGQFYPPTVIAGVTTEMRIWREETFGPVMVITPFVRDADAVRLANDCDFGLGSYAFSGSQARASAIGSQIQAGMFVVNDYASNAMCQSLPFGGVKESGFDRFGGIEGLRGMCVPKVVVLDRAPWLMKTEIPPPLQYPVAPFGFKFVHSLCMMFYGPSAGMRVKGLLTLAFCFLPQRESKKAA